MIKRHHILTLLITIVIISFTCCQKKLRGHVEVSGHVFDYITNEPIQVEVTLMGDDATSAKNSTEGTIILEKTTSNADGSFYLKSRPSRRDNYYISIQTGEKKEISVELNKNVDLGVFYAGSHDFVCSITIVPRSDSSLQLQRGSVISDYNSFAPGTATTVQNRITLTQSGYNGYNKSFPIWYTAKCKYPAYYGTSYYKSIPITSLTGLLATTIYY